MIARREDAADYIAEIVMELRAIARSANLYHVMIALDYAYCEAFSENNRVELHEVEIELLNRLAAGAAEFASLPPDVKKEKKTSDD